MIFDEISVVSFEDAQSLGIMFAAATAFSLFWRSRCGDESDSELESAKACAWFEAMSEQVKSQRLPRSAALIACRAMSNETGPDVRFGSARTPSATHPARQS